MTSEPSASVLANNDASRRNDLDALRASAMLLGIVLHGAMSFIPSAWVVEDSRAGAWAGYLVSAIHGFRMPLFFLLSGFFTAMLWRKRGLKSLLKHRFNRIFLPLLIGVFTIVPLVWVISGYVSKADISSTANSNDPGSTDESSERSAALGLSLLEASLKNDVAEVGKLLADGVNPDATDDRGSTSLHIACLFGYEEVATLLLDAGGSAEIVNADKSRPIDVLSAPWSITKFYADLLSAKVNPEQVARGREAIAARLGVTIKPENSVAAAASSNEWSGLIWLLTSFPVFHHLWFLWFLVWLVIGFSFFVAVGSRLRWTSFPRWMSVSAWRYAWLIPLTAMLQYGMSDFGPDTSIGLIPMPNVFAYYSIFFAFGAMYFDAQRTEGIVENFQMAKLGLSLALLFPLSLYLNDSGDTQDRLVAAILAATYAWLLSFAMIGLFERYMSAESRRMRYLSDASYWLYLAHIPLIMYVQYFVKDWSMTPWLKLPLICGFTLAVLLPIYEWMIRYTAIGTLLNGPRHRVTSNAASATAATD